MAPVKKKCKLSIFEIVWYSICLAVGVWGLTYIVLGLVAGASKIDSTLNEANTSFKGVFGLGFLGWGLIILGIATLAAVIVLCTVARKSDKEFEKAQRRAARLIGGVKPTNETPVIDVEATPSEDN